MQVVFIDNNPEFQRFFSLLLQTSPPGDSGSASASDRRALDVAGVVRIIEADNGTGRLSDQQARVLSEPASRPVIADKLGTLLQTRGYVRQDRHFLAYVSYVTDPSLLIPFLILVLQHRAISDLKLQTDDLFELYRLVIALRVLILSHSLGSRDPETNAWKALSRRLREDRGTVATLVKDLINNTLYFQTTYQFLCNGTLNHWNEVREGWKGQRLNLVELVPAPATGTDRRRINPYQVTDAEVSGYELLLRLEQKVGEIRGALATLQSERSNLREQRDRATDRDSRRRINHELKLINEELPALQRRLQQVNSELGPLRRTLTGRTEILSRYMARRDSGRYAPPSLTVRDSALREYESLIRSPRVRNLDQVTDQALRSTQYSLYYGSTEPGKWDIYRMLLDKLIDGDSGVALELLMNAYLVRYGAANGNRNLGSAVQQRLYGQTRPRHGENVLDLSLLRTPEHAPPADTAVALIAPPTFAVPVRLLEASPRLIPSYLYLESKIGPRDFERRSDLDDVYTKLATGLLRGPRGVSSVDKFMADHWDIWEEQGWRHVPDILRTRSAEEFGWWHIIAGLVFSRLTDLAAAQALDYDRERDRILDSIEDSIRIRLRLANNQTIFDRELGRSGGTFAVQRIIEEGLDKNRVIEVFQQILAENDQLIRDELWQLLWYFFECGAEFHSGGNSLVVDHTYVPPPGPSALGREQDLTVRILYSHLHSVTLPVRSAGRLIKRVDPERVGFEGLASPLGVMGLTGNAVTRHIHMQIRLRIGEVDVGTVLPHEFFAR